MVFHLTEKLRKKLKVQPEPGPHPVANPLLRWYGHLFFSKREQWILVTNEATLLSLLMPGRGLSNSERFVEYFHVIMEDYLEALGVKAAYDTLVKPYAAKPIFTKTESRSVLASMNDTIRFCKPAVCNYDLTVLDLTDMASCVLKTSIPSWFPLTELAGLIRQHMPEFAQTEGWDVHLRRRPV